MMQTVNNATAVETNQFASEARDHFEQNDLKPADVINRGRLNLYEVRQKKKTQRTCCTACLWCEHSG